MTAIRIAECRCGQLTATCSGEPVRVSVCHCLACQRRTGGPFAAQARFPIASVQMSGEWRVWERIADSGKRAWFRWCPECGSTVAYTNEGMDDQIAIALGAFADPTFPAPSFSVYENRKHPWIEIVGDDIEHD
jgi:hypothetical protein